jgi:pilus assembly protein CpaB
MQDLLVLATGRKTIRDEENQTDSFATITVEVTPDQAQRLVLAQNSGRLTALLRNPKDRRAHQVKPMDVYSLLGMKRPGSSVVNSQGPQMIIGGLGDLKIQNSTVRSAP